MAEHQEKRPLSRVEFPRIPPLMALAIRFEEILRNEEVRDQSELARIAHVTQPRMTQILNLLHLAPSIQEQSLHLPRVTEGKDPVHEKMLRAIAAEVDWGRQGGCGPKLPFDPTASAHASED